MELKFSCKIPMRTVSEGNVKEHWGKSGLRHNKQKKIVQLEFMIHKPNITLPCEIYLHRIAPRFLDEHDNLRMSFKYIVDSICEYIYPGLAVGRADGMPGINILYFQEKGKPKEYAIEIQIYCK
jgi:hypothetical protein